MPDHEIIDKAIRKVPDFPKPGVLFYDITGILVNPRAFSYCIERMEELYAGTAVDGVAAIESRGFIFAAPFALRRGLPLILLRKKGKLPFKTHAVTYELEYGTDTLEIHMDAIQPGQRVVLVDDLLATGGTMEATVKLVKQLGGEIAGLAFAVELDFLKGRDRFKEHDVFSLLHYDE